ncbi:lachesin-like [Nilaparvata lugens]|uniref:lachesin-like n=1 Tax=Nilaparvata lugens TaxID=108931 RepID=UPI00193E014E|nr:lachesin-like [Nilaparvata lugens]
MGTSTFKYVFILFWAVFVVLSATTSNVSGQQASTEPDPEFLAALENHTVTQGRDVSFTCVVNHLGTYKVAWIKSDSKAILAIHTHLVAHNSRLSVTHNGHNTWKLHVSNVQKNDSGTYMCQINTDPMRSQMGNLEVLIPPDIVNEDLTDALAAPEGGSVKLRCRATGIPEPTVVWRREDSASIVLRQETAREKQVVRSYDGETLLLSNIQRTDMGPYLCIASNGVPPTVSKRFNVQVHFHPVMKVSNQLVAAPVGSDVVIQCFVETSPKAMHSWFKDSGALPLPTSTAQHSTLLIGEKLMPGSKYDMQEVPLNAYSLMLNLTIRDLERRDFGGYVCSSVNALGKAEGVIRLQELSIPTKATVVPSPTYNDYTKVRKKQHSSHSKGGKPGRRGGQTRGHEEAESADRDAEVQTTTVVTLSPPTTSSRQPPPAFTLHGDNKATAASAPAHNTPAPGPMAFLASIIIVTILH